MGKFLKGEKKEKKGKKGGQYTEMEFLHLNTINFAF